MSSSLSPDQRKTLICRYMEMAWNEEVSSEALSLTTPDDQAVDAPTQVYVGNECLSMPLAQVRNAVRTTFPDIHLTINDLLVDGEKVVVRWFMQGTDLGGYEGHLPTGRSIHLTGITMLYMQDHTIVEEWNEVDIAGMLRQLGFVYIPQPPRVTMRRPGPTNIPRT